MADITTPTLTAVRRMRLPRLTLPKLRIGKAVASMYRAVGQALEMAYVAPYQTAVHRPPAADDGDLGGRDPNW